jgi:hypothetical protein
MASNQTNNTYGKSLEEIKAEARRYALTSTRMSRAPYSPTYLAPPATNAAAAPGADLPLSLRPTAATTTKNTTTAGIYNVATTTRNGATTAGTSSQQQQRPMICIDDEEYLRFVIGLNDMNSNSSSNGKKDPLVDQLLPGEDDDDEFLLDPLVDDDEEDLDDEDEEEEDDGKNNSSLPMDYGSPKNRSTKQRSAAGRGSVEGTSATFDDVDMDWDIHQELGWLQQDDDMDMTALTKLVNDERKMTPEQKKYRSATAASSAADNDSDEEVTWIDKLSGLNADRANPPMPTPLQQEKLRSLLKRFISYCSNKPSWPCGWPIPIRKRPGVGRRSPARPNSRRNDSGRPKHPTT